MIRKTVLLLTLLLTVASASALELSNETLRYKVLYKWGLIQRQAGTAWFTVSRQGDHLHARVIGHSAPWADKFYQLRDTLTSKMSAADLAPVSYERIAHEGGKYSRDKIDFSRSGNTFTAQAQRWRRSNKKGAQLNTASTVLKAEGMTVDLLTSFYYLRSLPFESMAPGKVTNINIFSAKKKERLAITYTGLTTLKIDNKEYKTYKVRFTFTTDGKKQSSDPIDAWISTDGRHIPLKLVGKLKIGQIQCIYTGN